MKVKLVHISHDKSPRKKVSHTKLLALVDELKVAGLVFLYRKKSLKFYATPMLADSYLSGTRDN